MPARNAAHSAAGVEIANSDSEVVNNERNDTDGEDRKQNLLDQRTESDD